MLTRPIVKPLALPGVMLITGSRAADERGAFSELFRAPWLVAAPLLMTAGYIASTNVNLFSGQMTTLPVYVYQEYSKLNANCPASADASCVTTIPMERAWAAALVLILIVLILNLIGRLVAKVFAVKSER